MTKWPALATLGVWPTDKYWDSVDRAVRDEGPAKVSRARGYDFITVMDVVA